MKKILFASLFLMAANLSFAQDKCNTNCHTVKHNCNVGCKKVKSKHYYQHSEKGHECYKQLCNHICERTCRK